MMLLLYQKKEHSWTETRQGVEPSKRAPSPSRFIGTAGLGSVSEMANCLTVKDSLSRESGWRDLQSGRGGPALAFETGATVFIFNMGLEVQDRCSVLHVQSFHRNPVSFDANDL